jgi:hypothetical protein
MSFSLNDIQSVWEKGQVDLNNDPNLWRKDQCGAWIGWQFYGNRDSKYGWEVDHIDKSNNNNGLNNLRPLQWENNANRQDGRLSCPITASGINNVRR